MKNAFMILLILTTFYFNSESKPLENTVDVTTLQPPKNPKLVKTQQLVFFNGIVPAEDQGLLEKVKNGAGPIFIQFKGDEEPTILDYSKYPEKTEALINNTMVLGRYFYRFLRTLYRAGTFLVSFLPAP